MLQCLNHFIRGETMTAGILSQKDYAYHNITISGLPGGGATTLLKLLKEELEEDGWRGFSGGEFMRDYAKEQGLLNDDGSLHHDATIYSDDFDRQVDFGMRERLSTQKNWILESWLSGFFAQHVEGTLKVLLICSDEAVRVDRVVNRDSVDIESAKTHIFERTQKNLDKWIRMYSKEWQEWIVEPGVRPPDAPIDFWHPDLYDIVIDTYSNSQEQTLAKVIEAIQPKKNTA